jgi:hypothetical protein
MVKFTGLFSPYARNLDPGDDKDAKLWNKATKPDCPASERLVVVANEGAKLIEELNLLNKSYCWGAGVNAVPIKYEMVPDTRDASVPMDQASPRGTPTNLGADISGAATPSTSNRGVIPVTAGTTRTPLLSPTGIPLPPYKLAVVEEASILASGRNRVKLDHVIVHARSIWGSFKPSGPLDLDSHLKLAVSSPKLVEDALTDETNFARVRRVMSGERLLNTLDDSTLQYLKTKREQYEWLSADGTIFNDGPTIIKILVDMASPSTRRHASSIWALRM